MMLNNYKHLTVDYVISNLTPSDKAKFNIKNGDETIATSTDILNYMLYTYGSFEIVDRDIATFISHWTTFTAIHNHEFNRIYNTLYQEYDPLANYDKHSTITTNGSTSSNSSGGITAYETTENDSTQVETGKTDNSASANVENSNTVTETTTGNIGTMTTGYMLSEEITNRLKYSFIPIVVDKFADSDFL